MNYKILVLTSVYPANDMQKAETPVVHYFAKEWVKMGYEVEVLHMPFNLPKLFFLLVRLFKKQLSAKMGIVVRTSPVSSRVCNMDGVNVLRIPLKKIIPHGRYSSKQIGKITQQSITYYKEKGFVPDVIISHWGNPQFEIMHILKEHYHVPTVYVAHNSGEELLRAYKRELPGYISETNMIGFRSAAIERAFRKNFGYSGPSFRCYSGIPSEYVSDDIHGRVFNNISHFVYVGTLIKRKYPSIIIPAVKKSYGNDNFRITYIGQGMEKASIEEEIIRFDAQKNVEMLGYMERDKVVEILHKSDVFVMISKDETYGLVYLEAMATGCITIASRNEGFDGIIEHGKNGFLCEAGNEDELSKLINEIRNLPKETLTNISDNAIKTARNLTDKKVAANYIESIRRII